MRGAFFGVGEGLVLGRRISCEGTEEQIRDCAHSIAAPCFPLDVAGVICPPENATQCTSGDVRLVGGDTRYQGRVEVCLHDNWGKVCDDEFERPDAMVVCAQLGYTSRGAVFATSNALHGSGEGLFLLDDVDCVGNETSLLQCRARDLAQHNCYSYEAAGVICPSEHLQAGELPVLVAVEASLMY